MKLPVQHVPRGVVVGRCPGRGVGFGELFNGGETIAGRGRGSVVRFSWGWRQARWCTTPRVILGWGFRPRPWRFSVHIVFRIILFATEKKKQKIIHLESLLNRTRKKV